MILKAREGIGYFMIVNQYFSELERKLENGRRRSMGISELEKIYAILLIAGGCRDQLWYI
jgi:hypothetical protein